MEPNRYSVPINLTKNQPSAGLVTLNGSPALDDAGRVAFIDQALGYTLLNIDSVNSGNLLPELASGAITGELIDPVRFDGNAPLQAGAYTFVLQNRQDDVLNFTFDFQTSRVPEPSTAGLLLRLGGFGVMRRRRCS